jgi:uncharacterized protein YjbI with pentapeptide repeats
MFPLYSRLLSRIDRLEQRLAEAKAQAAQDAPQDTPDPQIILDHIAQVSQNARATWFGLLGLLAFVGVTLLGHKDADFFAWGAATQLPLIGITVPVKAFFYTAPVLVAALYAYLHLYLMTLWDSLAEAPPQIDSQPLADRVFPWLISYAALWYRNRKRGDGSTAPRSLGRVVVAVSVLLGWLFGIAVFALLWWRSLPAHDEWLTLWIALCFWFAALVGYSGFMTACRRMAGASRRSVAKAHRGRRIAGGLSLVLLSFFSWETTEGGILNYRVTKDDGSVEWAQIIPLYPANLREAVLIAKPDDWQPYDRWLEEFNETYRTENRFEPNAELTPPQQYAFWVKAKSEWADRLAALTRLDLRQHDLRNADMARAVLPGADLRGARLDGANLIEAELQGARLDCWDSSNDRRYCSSLQEANLSLARMQGADLGSAEMQGAVLGGAKMQGANLYLARMQGADLGSAEMQGVVALGAFMRSGDLSGARMQGADLRGVVVQGANFRGAKMQAVDLHGAYMQGADLQGVEMQGTTISEVRMQGANLGFVDLENANCTEATLHGALLPSANLTCRHLTQEQLEATVGNSETVLPNGLTVASCLRALPKDVEAALTHHPEEGGRPLRITSAEIRDALLCGPGEDPVRFPLPAAPQQ